MKNRTPEHCHAVSRHYLFAIIVVLAALLISASKPGHAEHKVVLIAAKGSGIEMISNRDLRRLFLGLKSSDSSLVNRPVLNLHNRDVYEEFLKNVMHMTDGAYRRKLVKRIFRHGIEEIKEVDMLNELNEHLAANVGDISFVDYNDVKKMRDIEVVKVLW